VQFLNFNKFSDNYQYATFWISISKQYSRLTCCSLSTGMIAAIKEFCKTNCTNVNMRVGIHTGSVVCGIIGKKRRKVGKYTKISWYNFLVAFRFVFYCCKWLLYTAIFRKDCDVYMHYATCVNCNVFQLDLQCQ